MTYLSVFAQLNADTIVLTPNRRLSATLHQLYQAYQQNSSHQCWPTPTILPIAAWTKTLFDTYAMSRFTSVPMILSSTQEHYLWEMIIRSHHHAEQLLDVTETAKMTKSAWGLLQQWQLDTQHPLFSSSEDYMALHAWATVFEQQNKARHWLDSANLIHLITDKITSKEIVVSSRIMLIGFTELSPQLKNLLTHCEQAGSRIEHIEWLAPESAAKRLYFDTSESEITHMARWAKAIHSQQPQARIGCVIPSLENCRDRVLQLFSSVFKVDASYELDFPSAAFNLSAGKRLLHYPVIRSAFLILGLHQPTVPLETISALLTTPFIGEAEQERIKRSQVDYKLRLENIAHIQLDAPLSHSGTSLASATPKLAKRIDQFRTRLATLAHTRSFHEWAAELNELLALAGWPGERVLNSEEYQVVEDWLQLLQEFSSLDQIATPTSYHSAWQLLQKMAANRPFQVQTPSAPIQVLGILEAAGTPFDYLWVSGMDDLAWPPAPRPNPMIPKQLQRELAMPHATAERELVFCSKVTNQFKHSAPEVIFSHANQIEDLECQVSPLIQDVPLIALEDIPQAPFVSLAHLIYESRHMVSIKDDQAPPCPPHYHVHGGVSVIKTQAMCPFKAFAEFRLQAKPIESPTPGLRAKDRGKLVHKVLEITWNEIKDHATLLTLSPAEQQRIVASAIDAALTSVTHSKSADIQFMNLEKKRLQHHISHWLEFEKERPPFTVVKNEEEKTIQLNQLSLTLRIDRIDQLESGQYLIIDYKTGSHQSPDDWLGDRPEEPQLPIYALLDKTTTAGITFAQLLPGKNAFIGMSRSSTTIRGILPIAEMNKSVIKVWDEQILAWEAILYKLSDDFYAGIATVDPKNSPETCQWCALKPLCRIGESAYFSSDEEA